MEYDHFPTYEELKNLIPGQEIEYKGIRMKCIGDTLRRYILIDYDEQLHRYWTSSEESYDYFKDYIYHRILNKILREGICEEEN